MKVDNRDRYSERRGKCIFPIPGLPMSTKMVFSIQKRNGMQHTNKVSNVIVRARAPGMRRFRKRQDLYAMDLDIQKQS